MNIDINLIILGIEIILFLVVTYILIKARKLKKEVLDFKEQELTYQKEKSLDDRLRNHSKDKN